MRFVLSFIKVLKRSRSFIKVLLSSSRPRPRPFFMSRGTSRPRPRSPDYIPSFLHLWAGYRTIIIILGTTFGSEPITILISLMMLLSWPRCYQYQRCSLETLVLVSMHLKDMKTWSWSWSWNKSLSLDIGLEEKVLVLVFPKKCWYFQDLDEWLKIQNHIISNLHFSALILSLSHILHSSNWYFIELTLEYLGTLWGITNNLHAWSHFCKAFLVHCAHQH